MVTISLHTWNLKCRVNIYISVEVENFKLTKPSINLQEKGLSEQLNDLKVEPVPMDRSQPLLSINTCLAFGSVLEGVDSEDDGWDIKIAKDRVNYSDLLGFRPNHVCKTDPKNEPRQRPRQSKNTRTSLVLRLQVNIACIDLFCQKISSENAT